MLRKIAKISKHCLKNVPTNFYICISSLKYWNFDVGNLKNLDISNNEIDKVKVTSKTLKLQTVKTKGNYFQRNCDDMDFKKLHKLLQGKVKIIVQLISKLYILFPTQTQDGSFDECLSKWYPYNPSDYEYLWVYLLAAVILALLVGCIWSCNHIGIKERENRLPSNLSSANLIPKITETD